MSGEERKTERGTEGTEVVKNRDIPLLADVLAVMKEIEQLEERREWQEQRMYNITQHLTGMPGGGGNAKGFDGVLTVLSELDERHEDKCMEYAQKLRCVERILNGIESQKMRVFVLMKYVMGRSDTEIRTELNMTRRGFERAKKCVENAPCMSLVKWKEKYILECDD